MPILLTFSKKSWNFFKIFFFTIFPPFIFNVWMKVFTGIWYSTQTIAATVLEGVYNK